ncbi:MAG: molybdopterin molybdotransferase [Frankiales bacterium]|nr:molybdopterin molybdotransferase [Frankiales bacterium]
MRSVDEHLAEILSVVHPLQSLEVGLLDAHGCVLAEDVAATVPVPAHGVAAVDGYAVRSPDAAHAPVALPVVGDVLAGTPSPLRVQPGLSVRITAGSLLPQGADAVVPTAWTDGGLAQVRIDRAVPAGYGVSAAGADVAAGETVLITGTHLGAAQIGLAAGIGRARLQVRPRPRVVVLSTGKELVEPGTALGPGQAYDANSLALTTACLEAGAIAYRVGIVSDDSRSMVDTLEDQLVRADLIVLSAGVSPSSYDAVREVLGRLGNVAFQDVAMSPGTLHGFGTIGPDATPVFGLPGDAVGAQVSFEAFVRPALRRMLGVAHLARPMVSARAGADLTSPPGRRSFLRAWLEVRDGAYVVTPVPSTSVVAGLSRANALVVVPESVDHIAAGVAVQVVMLERRGL